MITRFAPSPTGLLHIGNARSAILNWAYAKKNKGKFILRIDDTDTLRSKFEFEKKIKEDLNWLGITWDKSFNQSSRKDLYDEKIEYLKKSERLYPCFESAEELALKKKSLLSSGRPPIYDRASLKLSTQQIDEKISMGKKPHWRFKLDNKSINWNDLIKGEVNFESVNLSDPVLIRENGTLLYHLPSVIDDITENITDIIRGEDHISNTAYHIQIFDALGSKIPNFAHHPFITNSEGKGFGKRINSFSLNNLKEKDYESITLLNYLLNIGSSKDIIAEKNILNLINDFNLKNISTSSVKFSDLTLTNLNKEILQSYEINEVVSRIKLFSNQISEDKLWKFVKNNISFFSEIKDWIKIINSNNNLDKNKIDKTLFNAAIENLPDEPFDEDTWQEWTDLIKLKTGFKGKDLFMPLRIALTGLDRGPELKYLMPLLNKDIILKKFGKL